MSERPLELWAGIECTVNRIGDAHFDQLAHNGHDHRLRDLDLFAELGARRVRYPVLWERTQDWSWSDERLCRLRELGIDPIVGLVHHGSGPLGTNLLDERFPAQLAAFALRVAERYPWVKHWTPINEPLTTARFSALYGHWYPHATDDRSFIVALLNQLRAIVLAMRAIRTVIPQARLVQTEDIGKVSSTPELAYQADFENERRWMTYDLLTGSLPTDGLVARWLQGVGISESALEWFRSNPCRPDIFGVNHYLSGDRFLDHRLDRYPPETHGGNGLARYADILAARVLGSGAPGPASALRETWERYEQPIAVTEAHNGCTREEQLRWLREVWDVAEVERENGADIRAVTIWSILGAFGWNELLTSGLNAYEPGAYDVRAPTPRPTALASLAKALAAGEPIEHPALEGPGWWTRPERLTYPAVGPVVIPPRQRERRLLITGATGTLGQGFSRICTDRGLAHRPTFRDELELTDESSMLEALTDLRPWAVINTAAYVCVDDAEVDDRACFAANRDGVHALARACAHLEIPLVTFSSDLVFDGRSPRPYVETDEPNPLNVYGRSKAQGEALALAAHSAALVIRTSAFFGPWDPHNFATTTLAALKSGQAVCSPDDVVVSPTYIPDLVHATLDLLIDGEQGLWHLANEGTVDWAAFARRIADAAEVNARLVHGVPSTEVGWIAQRPAYSALTSERGWIMPTLDDALARYIPTLAMSLPTPGD
jgi:dTDP-4-dehydrorhamnose reductase